MIRRVNFIVRGPNPSFYYNIMRSIVDPIRLYLPESVLTEMSQEDAVNVHFFHEEKYRAIVPIDRGINVFMSHGIADKGWRDGPAMIPFDYVCVSGPLWKSKLINSGVTAGRIFEIGFPKLDPVFQGLVRKEAQADMRKTVLYAPTHAKAHANCSSYPAFLELLKCFPEDFKIVSSLHPVHKKDQMPTFQELVDADLVISDCSSLLYEAWSLDKPVVFPDWLVKDGIIQRWPNSFAAHIYKEGIGYHAVNFDHLLELVYLGLSKGIDSKAAYFIEEYFPAILRGRSGRMCAALLQNLVFEDLRSSK